MPSLPTVPSLLVGSLPSSNPGPHEVGYFSIKQSALKPYTLPTPRFGSNHPDGHLQEGVECLGVREIGYSVFYPCSPKKSGWLGIGGASYGVSWLVRPFWATLEGYKRFSNNNSLVRAAYPVLRFLGGRLKIPIYPFAPLAEPTSPTTQFPLAIFSHGLAGTSLAYSHFCASLASQGYVVLSIGHRDGSGPCYFVKDTDGKELKISYLKFGELDWSPEPTPTKPDHLRSMQLDIRVSEIYETYHGFSSILFSSDPLNAIPGLVIEQLDSPTQSATTLTTFLSTFQPKVNLSSVTVTGHSFGGGTIFHLLQSSPPNDHLPIPITQAIALDPWVEPVPTPTVDNKPPKKDVRLMVINSERFTVWTEHFEKVKGLVKEVNGTLITIIGCEHQSFSDFPLLVTTASASQLLKTIMSLSIHQLTQTLTSTTCPEIEGVEVDNGKFEVIIDPKSKLYKKQKMVGEWGDVKVHLLGP